MKRSPKDPILLAFGRRVAELRAERGLTQEQLAADTGKAARYIQSVEAGDQNVTLLTVGALAEALGVGPGDFFV